MSIILLTSCLPFFNAFFVTIAGVLGTGILGLPVKLSQCGFFPFFISFFPAIFAQGIIVCFMVELLQKADVVETMMREKGVARGEGGGGTHRQEGGRDDHTTETTTTIAPPSPSPMNKIGPNLHSLSHLFLSPSMTICFTIAVLVHFLSILVSYALAGSLAYGHLLNINYKFIIPPFIIGYALFIIIGDTKIQSAISVTTLVKGVLLVVMVGVVGVIGSSIQQPSTENWRQIGDPFLLGTVALGGAANVIPIVYSTFDSSSATLVARFRFCCCAALGLCFILNIFWALFILWIVPQTGPAPSLEYAMAHGEIATIPVTTVIRNRYPQYNWLGSLVDTFIMISITVSYLTLGAGLKHLLDGLAYSLSSPLPTGPFHVAARVDSDGEVETNYLSSTMHHPSSIIHHPSSTIITRASATSRALYHRCLTLSPSYKRYILYFVCFGSVLVISCVNPEGFILFLETFTSMALNLEAGVFVCMMLAQSRRILPGRQGYNQAEVVLNVEDHSSSIKNNDLSSSHSSSVPSSTSSSTSSTPSSTNDHGIALPLSNSFCYHATFFCFFYFVFAVIYDIYSTLVRFIHPCFAACMIGSLVSWMTRYMVTWWVEGATWVDRVSRRGGRWAWTWLWWVLPFLSLVFLSIASTAVTVDYTSSTSSSTSSTFIFMLMIIAHSAASLAFLFWTQRYMTSFAIICMAVSTVLAMACCGMCWSSNFIAGVLMLGYVCWAVFDMIVNIRGYLDWWREGEGEGGGAVTMVVPEGDAIHHHSQVPLGDVVLSVVSSSISHHPSSIIHHPSSITHRPSLTKISPVVNSMLGPPPTVKEEYI